MEQANEAVIRKIQLLLNLAGDKSNENEAAVAMGKAQELLAKYNLEMATVEGASSQAQNKRETRRITKSAMYRWQQELWATIADCNFCWHFITHEQLAYRKRGQEWDSYRKVKRHKIVGRMANVTAVQLMGEYLCETIERILPYENKDRLSNAALSWRQGCSDRLRTRILNAFHEARTRDVAQNDTSDHNSTALALRSITDAEYAGNYDHLYGEGAYARSLARQAEASKRYEEIEKANALKLANETPAQRKEREKQEARWAKAAETSYRQRMKEEAKRRDNMDWSAYEQGSDAGNSIGLNKQVGTSPTRSLP